MAILLNVTAAGLVLFSSAAQTSMTWEALEARQTIVSAIDIVVHDVFDLSRASESHWVGRLSNAIHLETREGVVRRELLFAAGAPVDARAIRETERNLRRYAFVRDARIVPMLLSGTAVRARVEVYDAWSLQGDLGVSRTGGNSEWSVRLDEANLLGHGKRVFVEHERDIERDATGAGYTDPQLFGSRWALSVGYSDLSDGAARGLFLERPYFSIETRYSVGLFAGSSERRLTQYNQGAAVNVVPVRSATATVFASRAYRVRDRTAFRAGVAYRAEEHEYGSVAVHRAGALPPPDVSTRRVRGLAATWAMVEERAVAVENLRTIGRTEDYNIGWSVRTIAGYFATAMGSTTSAPFAEVAAEKGWHPDARTLLLLNGRPPAAARAADGAMPPLVRRSRCTAAPPAARPWRCSSPPRRPSVRTSAIFSTWAAATACGGMWTISSPAIGG